MKNYNGMMVGIRTLLVIAVMSASNIALAGGHKSKIFKINMGYQCSTEESNFNMILISDGSYFEELFEGNTPSKESVRTISIRRSWDVDNNLQPHLDQINFYGKVSYDVKKQSWSTSVLPASYYISASRSDKNIFYFLNDLRNGAAIACKADPNITNELLGAAKDFIPKAAAAENQETNERDQQHQKCIDNAGRQFQKCYATAQSRPPVEFSAYVEGCSEVQSNAIYICQGIDPRTGLPFNQ